MNFVGKIHCIVLVVLACAATGCATGLRLAELPEDPIVFVHLTEQEARENRQVQNAKQGLGSGVQSSNYRNKLVPNANELKALLGVVEVAKQATPGRVMQLDPQTGELRPFDAVLRGAWPHAWNRARTHFVFSYRPDMETRSQIFVLDAARGDVRQLTFDDRFHPFANFVADERILVSVGEDVPSASEGAPPYLVKLRWLNPDLRFSEPIVEYSVKQKEQMQVWAEINPAVAPDGKLIVFEALDAHTARPSLFVLDMTQPTEPPRFLARGSDPVFAPDGSWVVYTGPPTKDKMNPNIEETKIWRIRTDGSGRTQVGQGRGIEREPAVSPDGKFIVYTVEEDDRLRLYIKRFDGSGERVLFADGDGWLAVW